jgi:hypothetical protein
MFILISARLNDKTRIIGRRRSAAYTFWKFEDLWQSPIGDVSHAVKLPVGVALRPPEISVYRRAGAAEIDTRELALLGAGSQCRPGA